MTSKKGNWIDAILLLLLFSLSVEILLRRLYWEQIPTQIPAVGVWVLLLLNASVIGSKMFRGGRRQRHIY